MVATHKAVRLQVLHLGSTPATRLKVYDDAALASAKLASAKLASAKLASDKGVKGFVDRNEARDA